MPRRAQSFRYPCGLNVGVEQAVHRRAGARQRSVTRALAQQQLFYLTQLGILWKDDAFEVILDPGLDEVEKRRLGPVPAPGGNTGCRLDFSLRDSLSQPVEHTSARPIDCTCEAQAGQSIVF